MTDLDAGRLWLRPIGRDAARAVLDGRLPDGVILAPGYPSQFSLEVMELVAETLVGHAASRRVVEKAGMRLHDQRVGEVDGERAELVVYQVLG
jgi:hypothetical protein